MWNTIIDFDLSCCLSPVLTYEGCENVGIADKYNSHLSSSACGGPNCEEDKSPKPTPPSDEWILKNCTANLEKGILNIPHLMLKEIPNCIYGLKPLITIAYLHDNRISTIPETFWENLPMLAWLDLRNNRLRILPELRCEQKCLRVLNLRGNKLTNLPNSLALAGKLKSITVDDNPLKKPPESVVEQGSDVIMQYLAYQYSLRKRCQSICKKLPKSRKKETSTDSESEQKLVTRNNDSASPHGIIIDEEHRQKYAMMDDPESGDYWRKVSKLDAKRVDQVIKNTVLSNSQFYNLSAHETPEIGRNASLQSMWYMKKASVEKDRILQRMKDKEFIEKWRQTSRVLNTRSKNNLAGSDNANPRRLIHPWEVITQKESLPVTAECDFEGILEEAKQCVSPSALKQVDNSAGFEDILKKLEKVRDKLRNTKI